MLDTKNTSSGSTHPDNVALPTPTSPSDSAASSKPSGTIDPVIAPPASSDDIGTDDAARRRTETVPVVTPPPASAADGEKPTILGAENSGGAANAEPPRPSDFTNRQSTKPIAQPPETLEVGDATEALIVPEESQAPEAESHPTESFSCPVCGQRFRAGELMCSYCGHVFATAGKTTKFEEDQGVPQQKVWPTGEVLTTEQKPITFEIDNKQVRVLISESITVGRSSDIPGDSPPDVDLTPFGAGDLGVSRRHIRIRRKGILLYVADLKSTNGTLLNGRRLIPEGERLIRSGDELRLGHLKIRVKF